MDNYSFDDSSAQCIALIPVTQNRAPHRDWKSPEDAAFAHGIRSYAKNGMVREVTQELLDAIIEAYRPDPRISFFTHTAGGAVKRVDESATAFPHRNAETIRRVRVLAPEPKS